MSVTTKQPSAVAAASDSGSVAAHQTSEHILRTEREEHANDSISKQSLNPDQVLMVGPADYKSFVLNNWPGGTPHAAERAPLHTSIYDQVKNMGVPNYMGARIPIPSGLNIPAWRTVLSEYPDNKICEYLEYGWPINYTATFLPQPTPTNHQSALEFPDHVQEFLDTECRLGAMLGPFDSPPYTPWFQISPMMTRPKKDSHKRRVIVDLSFP